MSETRLIEARVADVVANGANPRVIDEQAAAFRELVESVRANGVIIPVHVARLGDDGSRETETPPLTLLAGERRWRAAQAAGRETIPAIEHVGPTEAEAFEVTFAENYCRADLTPIEEGRAVHTLLLRYQGDVAAVAAKLGRSPRWVATLRAIDDALAPSWKHALAKGTLPAWTSAHLALIARLPAAMQDELLERYSHTWAGERWQSATIKEIEADIAERLRLLRRAPWPLDDMTLGDGLMACQDCTRRTSAQPELWHDDVESKAVKKDDRCLDGKCWQAKERAFVQRQVAVARQQHGDRLILIAGTDANSNDDETKALGKVYHVYEYDAAKAGADGARPAFVVAGKGAGTPRWVKLHAWADQKGRGERPRQADGTVAPKPLKERRAELDRKRWAQVIAEVREALEKAEMESVVIDAVNRELHESMRQGAVMACAAIFGIDQNHAPDIEDADRWAALRDAVDRTDAASHTARLLWPCVRAQLSDELASFEGVTQTSDDRIALCKQLAGFIGLDAEAMFAEVSQRKGFAEPKSWAALAEAEKAAKKTKRTKETKGTKAIKET